MPRKACTPSRTVPCTAPPEVWTVGVVAVTPRTLAPRPARTDPAAARGAPTCCTRPLDRGRRVEVTGGRERPSPSPLRRVWSAEARLAAFVAVLVSSSLPFWLLLRSVRLHGLGLLLPASALVFVCPVAVATVLAAIEGERAEVATLWRRSVDVTAARYAGWVAAVVLLPALLLLATLLDHGSVTLPPAPVPLAAVPLLTVVYLVTALAEEVGWTAYLTDRMLLRLGTTGTGLVLGAVWGAWHLVPYLQVGRDAGWIGWQCRRTVAARVLVVEGYSGSGRCVPIAVVYAGLNVATAALPGAGPDLDPAPVAVVLGVAAVAIGILRAWRGGRSWRRGRARLRTRRRRLRGGAR